MFKEMALNKFKSQKELEEIFGDCRDANIEEQESILNHIKEISETTGINFYDEYIEENYIFSKNDLYINFEKFESGKSNICLVTGLSGSGKSTIASSLATKHNAEWIELDNFEQCYGFNDEQLKQAGQVFYDYLSSHKELWDKLKSKSIKGKDLGIEINKFVHYCISWCNKDKENKYIIEGVQIYSFMKYKEIKSYPLIIKNTSMIKSIIQRWKRNGDGKIDLIKELKNEFPQLVDWYRDEEKSLNQFRNSINESYIEESKNTPVKKSYGINIDGKYNAIVEIDGESARMRGRSELLIIKDNMIYLSKIKKGLCGNYDVPGGGWDKGEDHSKSAIREAQEEARLKSKNVKYSGYYTVVYDQPHKWVRNKVDPKYQWRGYYTEVFIGEYDGKYNGKIADIDKDELIDTGKFYPVEEVYEELHPVHQKAIDEYLLSVSESYIEESKDRSKLLNNFKKKEEIIDFKFTKFPSKHALKYLDRDPDLKNRLNFVNKNKVGHLAIDVKNDKVAGYVFVGKESKAIAPLFVYDEYRGYGLGHTLVQHAINMYGGTQLGVYKDNEVAINLYKNHGFEIVDSYMYKNKEEVLIMKLNEKTYMSEATIEEASYSSRKYRCPYCDNHISRDNLPSHIEDKHEDMIPKDMTPLQITFNTINKKNHGVCTICRNESPWNEQKGRYDRICEKKSCHDTYVKTMKSRMINKYGREHNLNDADVQSMMLKNRKISGTYIWSDSTKFSYCGTYEKTLLEFLDKVLLCKSEDIITPGPVIDYTFNGENHQWITDLYYIPYNLCFDVKDGGSNPNTRPMEEYRNKQTAKEIAIKEQGKYNYIRLTNNDFTQLFEIFLELKLSFDDNKIVRINEECSTTINALPSIDKEKGQYIIQYMMKNTFTNGYAYTTNNELTDDINIIDTFGNKSIIQRDEFLNMIDEYTIFKYIGDYIEEETISYNTYPIDYYYTNLTGRRLIDDKQIFIDSNFVIENKLEDKLNALKEVYISSLSNNIPIEEGGIGYDINGIYKYNKDIGLRTRSYDNLEDIDENELKIIEDI